MRFTGFICDRDGCQATAEGSGKEKNQVPYGWPRVNITTDGEVTARDGEKVFCSNTCSFIFFGHRLVEVDGGIISKTLRVGGLTKPRGEGEHVRSEEARANMAEGQLRSAHAKGSHDSNPRPSCPLCEEATAAVAS